MFWILDTLEDFVKDPIRTTVKVATQPLRDTLEVIDWLTEWEIRTKAIARLWADAVMWMATSELIEWYQETN